MKLFSSLLLLGVLALPACALQLIWDQFPASNYATVKTAELHGPVKAVRTYTKKGGILVDELAFDRDGRLTRESYHHPNTGKRLWQHSFTYNVQGWLIKAVSQGEYVGETGASATLKYDVKGLLIEQISYTAGGKAISKRTMSYDDQGRKVSEEAYIIDKTSDALMVSWSQTTRYDDHGNVVQVVNDYPRTDQHEVSRMTYAYSPEGRKLREETVRHNGEKILRVFSPQGKVLEDLYLPYVGPHSRTGSYHHLRHT